MIEMKQGHRAILRELLRGLGRGPARGATSTAIAIFLIAGLEGLSLERLERGETAGAEARARDLRRLGDACARRLAEPPATR